MTPDELEHRLIRFGVRCTLLCRAVPVGRYRDAKLVADQLLRASTHAGFHYPEARSAESTKDFLHKLKVLLKELREARAELRYIYHMEYLPKWKVEPLLKESSELVAIFIASTRKLTERNSAAA
ncbi:four helix bundle protein [Lewinella sp. IMCC34183]|uniref:four helix bundle protein n=1 Tax=Lewinella sp. IMCC34183 TaxID=2248762 RepID=UPI000E2590E2|nr:four helix bundle protein [Lewinella sp. IMCC34183]